MLLVQHFAACGQEYYIKQYRVEKGLPSDIVKSSTQDALGYFWVATDEGIVKYDGIKFTGYREAMHSNFAKGFLTTRDGRLLAFSDLDLIEIKNFGDTVHFVSQCPVSRIATDSSLSYPKLIFEDSHEDFWVSESQAVVRLQGSSLKRYHFGLSNRSPQFLRSFTFFEDKKNKLYISSVQGNVFRYNTKRDRFEALVTSFPAGVEFASVFDGKLIIGSSEGLFEASLLKNGGFEKPRLRADIPSISYVSRVGKEKYFIGTRSEQHYMADLARNTFQRIPKSINNINHVYISREKDLWISGNEGLIFMREDLFQTVNEQANDFIESIAEDPNTGIIYYATGRTLYAFDPSTNKNTTLLNLPFGYFQSLIFAPEGLWAANAFQVFLFADGKIQKEFDFSPNRMFVTNITRDSNGNIWLAIPGDPKVHMIDRSMTLHHFDVPLENEGVINVVREGANGMYIGSAGKNTYLYFMSATDSAFRNVSVPLNFIPRRGFNVGDLMSTGNILWLASSEGLLKLTNGHIEKEAITGTFKDYPVSAIKQFSDDKILFSNTFGMIFYDVGTHSYDLFTESSGLLSNTITSRGIFVSKDKTVWVGTAKGLGYNVRPLTYLDKTQKPTFTQILINGKKLTRDSDNSFAYGTFLSIQVSSITFPENEIRFEYRLLPDTTWQSVAGSELQLSRTAVGEHVLEVRSKKNGPYTWSDANQLRFRITRPYWQRVWFYLVCAFGAGALVTLTFFMADRRNEKRTVKLRKLVDDQTAELRISNEELISLNLEKNNLIEIVAHDLKSPLNQILGLLSIIKMSRRMDEESSRYLAMMETSALKLNKMIMKILDVESIESRKLKLTVESVCLSDMCHSVADRHRMVAGEKNIRIVRKIEDDLYANLDRGYLEQVLENLVSNAIKFSPFDRAVFVCLSSNADSVVCEIRDEGPGLSYEDKGRLFGKYQKLSARPTGNEVSTGLGLSIVKKLVDAMGGQIRCESELGRGASFFVSFAKSSAYMRQVNRLVPVS